MNNFKSQKTSLARTTLGLVCAQKSNRLIRYIVFVVMAVGLTACGGGGSSSGGGTAVVSQRLLLHGVVIEQGNVTAVA